MTPAAVEATISYSRLGWRALLWIAPLTAAWVALNYTVPIIATSGVPTVTSRLSIHVMIALGLWLGLERAELTPAQRRNTWLAVMIPFTLWLPLIRGPASHRAVRPRLSPIPPTPLVF